MKRDLTMTDLTNNELTTNELTVRDLHLDYGTGATANPILKGVSMHLKKGEVVALLGPSGSGKTTLLRAVAGLESPKQGSIAIGERQVFDGASKFELAAEHRNLGLVFQSYALWPHKTVFENVAYGLKLRKLGAAEIRDKVADVLKNLGLGHLGERYPHQLSGGQQQRVAIARALVYNPPVILLDEPLSNLDAKLREEARAFLRELIVRLGLSALMVTHDEEVKISAMPVDNAMEPPLLTCMYLGDRFECLFKHADGSEAGLCAYSKYKLEAGRYWLQLPAEKLWVLVVAVETKKAGSRKGSGFFLPLYILEASDLRIGCRRFGFLGRFGLDHHRGDGGYFLAARDLLEAVVFGQHLDAVTVVMGKCCRADVALQAGFDRTATGDVILEDQRADTDVGHRIERRLQAAHFLESLMVHLGHDLHQALRAHRAFGEWVQSRFDGHHGQDQQRVELDLTRRQVGGGHQHIGGVTGHAIALRQPRGHPLLLLLGAQQGFFLFRQRRLGASDGIGRGGRWRVHQGRQRWRYQGDRFCYRDRVQAVAQGFGQVRTEKQYCHYNQSGHTEYGQGVLGGGQYALGRNAGVGQPRRWLASQDGACKCRSTGDAIYHRVPL